MKRYLILFMMSLLSAWQVWLCAQTMGGWRTHFAYNSVTQVEQTDNKVYAVSDGAAIVAAALSPDGRGLALLCAGEHWFIRRWDMLAGESADEPLEGPALSLKWDENGLRTVYAEAAER